MAHRLVAVNALNLPGNEKNALVAAIAQAAVPATGWSALVWMEKIMSALNLGSATKDRELQDDELDAVSGGLVVPAIIGWLIDLLPSSYAPTTGANRA
jgi:hypothetical protein